MAPPSHRHRPPTAIPSAIHTAPQGAPTRPNMPFAPTTPPTVRIQFRQNGTLHSLDLPNSRPISQPEIELLQEYAQNTALGTTNILGPADSAINTRLQTYGARFRKLRGGLFDGLTRDEAVFLMESAWHACARWDGEGLSAGEAEFLCEAGVPGARPVLPPRWGRLRWGFKVPAVRCEGEDDDLEDVEARVAKF